MFILPQANETNIYIVSAYLVNKERPNSTKWHCQFTSDGLFPILTTQPSKIGWFSAKNDLRYGQRELDLMNIFYDLDLLMHDLHVEGTGMPVIPYLITCKFKTTLNFTSQSGISLVNKKCTKASNFLKVSIKSFKDFI